MDDETPKRPTIRPASRLLQAIVGFGKVKAEKVEQSQERLEAVKDRIDISEFAEEHIKEIKENLQKLKDGQNNEQTTQEIARSIMQFKGNVGMLSSASYVQLSTIMLRWIESVQEIDEDVLDVLNGYHITLDQIFNHGLDSKAHIDLIVNEMHGACERYFEKHPELTLTKEIDNNKAFYVAPSVEKVGLSIEAEGLSDSDLIEDKD